MVRIDPVSTIEAKKAAGQAAARFIQDGMQVGLGTGSTAAFFIEALGQRCKQGLQITAIATSLQSAHEAQLAGIPLIDDQTISYLDVAIDGADEIDHHKNMIKGGGGALLREKLIAKASKEFIAIVDETKLVDRLGAFPLPVEISSFAYLTTLKRMEENGYHGKLRLNRDEKIYRTDNGNYIVDIQFSQLITDPEAEDARLRRITGVLETGLFYKMAKRVIVGYLDGFVKIQA
jgi:ribose 5-phosphate isomerase A